MTWGFYGRSQELLELEAILTRGRWFFARITGRRRIGKTTLIQQALHTKGRARLLYLQVPDADPLGVLSAFADALTTFGIDPAEHPAPTSLRDLATTIGNLALAGYIVALDEFQYFSRKALFEFTSHLQATVDDLAARAADVPGGLIVLGSIHTEMVALLEDRTAPLYNRTTDHLHIGHLDAGSILELLREHADPAPQRLLFLWSLFEGVPKFYRDCFEQGVLGANRQQLLRQMFFRSSSPLRTEAEHWFLSELRGRYDVILKFIARHPGCTMSEIKSHFRAVSPGTADGVSSYLNVLMERYEMVERRLPIFAKPTARQSRYYLRDNFLRSWLGALAAPVSALNFKPEATLVDAANGSLIDLEGHSLERLVGALYEERSRKGLGDFPLSHRVQGYWDRSDTEIDLVALNQDDRVIRFGTCKRSASKLVADLDGFEGHISRFLQVNRRYEDWVVQRIAIAPTISGGVRDQLSAKGYVPQDLVDLTAGL